MSREGALALSCCWTPYLHHAVFTCADNAQVVSLDGPDTFEMAKESAQAESRGHVP